MKLLELFATMNEGILDASIESAMSGAAARLIEELLQNSDTIAMDLFNLQRYGDPHEEDLPEDHMDAFTKWLSGWVEERIHDVAYIITNGMKYDATGIELHRVITADADWIENIDAQPLGVYWSWDKNAAEAHWGDGGSIHYHIVGLVSPESVDWEHTLFQNAHPSFEEEKEIYVYDGAPVKVVGLWANDKEVDPSLYAGKEMLQASVGLSEAEYSDSGQKFYHVSNDALSDGTILEPTGKEWEVADKVLEKYRPRDALSRQQSVYMFPTFEDAEFVGLGGHHGVEGYLYEVEPMGDRQWHHVFWYAQIVRELRDHEVSGGFGMEEDELEEHMKEYAYKYWYGEEAGEDGWEIASPRARIVRYLGPAEDVLYESRKGSTR